ncbi:MAG: SH3 domain-containing protein [Microcoleaceae cyanobacterium]
MSFKPNQWVIAGVAGVTTAVAVAYTTIQSRSSQPEPEPIAQVSSQASPSQPKTEPQTKPKTPDPSPVVPSSRPSESTSSSPPSPRPPAAPNSPEVSPASTASPVVIRPMAEGCRISMAVVDDPEPPLNVRSEPKVSDSNIVGQLENQTFVSIEQEKDGWLQINSPVKGWIAKNRTRSSCTNMEQPIQFLPGGHSALVKGQIIGGGSHRYTVEAKAGQTLTVESYQAVFPRIVTPDGQSLNEVSGPPGKQTEWTGQVPLSGEYTIELDSNFRGYEYEFSVEVQ